MEDSKTKMTTENKEDKTRAQMFESLLITISNAINDMMHRTQTTHAQLCEKLGWPTARLQRILDGLDDELDTDDIEAIAEAMGYKSELKQIPHSENNPPCEPTYQIIDGLPDPPQEENDDLAKKIIGDEDEEVY